MKKFSIKSLLVLVLVLVLVLSIGLVACNKKKNNDQPSGGGGGQVTPPSGGDDDGSIDKDSFFGNMWELANDIGGEAITASDNVGLSLDLSVAMRQVKAGAVEEENFNVGIALDIVLDRNSKDNANKPLSTNSAVKARIYNGATGETWLAVYYFLADPTNVYFDLNFASNIDFLKEHEMLQKRYYKVNFDTDGNLNGSYAASVADFINNHKFGADPTVANSGFSIADIVDAVVSGTGPDWSLNTLIENIAGIFDLDLKEISKKVGSFLPGMYDEVTDTIHIENALSSSIVKSLLGEPTTTEKDGGKEYAVTLNIGRVLSLASDMLSGLPSIVTTILNENTEFTIKYGEKDNKINGFALVLGLAGLKDPKTNIYPQFELAIRNLELRKVANTAAATKERVGFVASNWANADTLNVNKMLNCEATIEVEHYDKGVMTPYRVTMYSDIDIINVIEKAIKMSKAEDGAERARLLGEIDAELGLKVEEIDAQGALVPGAAIPFQLLASCAHGELSAVVGEKTYIIDVADIVENWDELFGAFEMAEVADDDDEGGFDISGIMAALDIITETVKINGEELSLDALKAIFIDEDGEFKENWHEFLLDANFTKALCNELAEAFGGVNANEVSVNIQKQAHAIQARAEYLNDAGYDAQGAPVKAPYFVNIEAEWSFEDNSLSLELAFNMWDEDAENIVTYVCTYEGSLEFEEITDGKLLKSGEATLALTRQYRGDNSLPESVFVATLNGEINYNNAKDSITDANILLVVSKAGLDVADPVEYFRIAGDLVVSGTGKVLVVFTDDGYEYTSTDGVVVDTTITESLLQWIGQLDVEDEDGNDVQIKDYIIPVEVVEKLQKFNLAEDDDIVAEESVLTVGELLGRFNVHLDGRNIIRAHYEKYLVPANDSIYDEEYEQELFSIGLNESESVTMHLSFEFHRDLLNVLYVKCVYDLGEGETGLAVRLNTWTTEAGGDYAGTVVPPARRDQAGALLEGVNLIDSDNVLSIIAGLMGFEEPEGGQVDPEGGAVRPGGGEGGQVDPEGGATRPGGGEGGQVDPEGGASRP